MAIPPEKLEEIKQLMAALRDDFITEEQTGRLRELLRSDPELRGLYIRYMAMEEHLREHLSDFGFTRQPGQGESVSMLLEAFIRRSPAGESEEGADSTLFGQVVDLTHERDEEEEILHAPPRLTAYIHEGSQRGNRIAPWLVAAMAAVMLIAVGVFLFRGPTTNPSVAVVTTPVPPPIAALSAQYGVQWSGSAPTPADFVAGKQLLLAQGCAELTFGSGAQVVVEAPASILLQSPSAVFLDDGRLTARAPGGGFMVHTSGATITDLGTEFGVATTASGTVNVAVFQGSVAVATQTGTAGATPRVVAAGNAVQADSAGAIKPAAANVALSFIRDDELQARIKAEQGSAYNRWLAQSYQIRRDPDLVAYYTFENKVEAIDRVRNMATTGSDYDVHLSGASPLPSFWTEGRFPGKGALTLPADGDMARLNIPVAFHNLTMVISVRIDPKTNQNVSENELLSSALGRRVGVYTSFDPNLSRAVFLGFPFTKVGALFMPIDSNLSMGHWMQIAVVYDSATQQAAYYCQGEPGQQLHLDKWADLTIGDATIGVLESSTTNIANRLHGAIDEIMIYRRALAPAEVKKIYEDGQP